MYVCMLYNVYIQVNNKRRMNLLETENICAANKDEWSICSLYTHITYVCMCV